MPVHDPGQVFTDLAVADADGADCVSGIAVLVDRQDLFGPVASMPTTWRLLDRIDGAHLEPVRAARAQARAKAWAAGAGPDPEQELCIDFDATITIAHSEKESAAATWKRTFGFHPLLAFLDRPDIAGGEALAGLLRPGNAGSNTAKDHISVLDQALASLPAHAPPGTSDGPRVLARSDSAGATHAFATACRERGVGFSFGFPVDMRIKDVVDLIPDSRWSPATEADGDLRDSAWVAEATGMIDLSAWPEGSRLILRKERPHPGAQLSFTDTDGHRVTAFLTDTAPGAVPGQAAGLELRHRQHARIEDRIRRAKATGLPNLPCRGIEENAAWLQVVLTATDMIAWAKLIAFADHPTLARCERDAMGGPSGVVAYGGTCAGDIEAADVGRQLPNTRTTMLTVTLVVNELPHHHPRHAATPRTSVNAAESLDRPGKPCSLMPLSGWGRPNIPLSSGTADHTAHGMSEVPMIATYKVNAVAHRRT